MMVNLVFSSNATARLVAHGRPRQKEQPLHDSRTADAANFLGSVMLVNSLVAISTSEAVAEPTPGTEVISSKSSFKCGSLSIKFLSGSPLRLFFNLLNIKIDGF